MDSRLQYLLSVFGLSIAVALVHLSSIFPSIVDQFVVLFSLLFHASLLGKRLLVKTGSIPSIVWGTILLISTQSVLQVAWYYSNQQLGRTSDVLSFILSGMIWSMITWNIPLHSKEMLDNPQRRTVTEPKTTALTVLLFGCTLGALVYVLFGAHQAATSDSIRTPWPLLPKGSLLAVAFAWISIYLAIELRVSRFVTAIQTGFAVFMTSSLTAWIYRVGFGFDGFLHIATERIILATGTFHPKPPYYLGQYVFTTWFSRILNVPIESVDRWLFPLATLLLIPCTIYLLNQEGSHFRFFSGLMLLLPLGAFIATTPQSFAYLLGFLALCLALKSNPHLHPSIPLSLCAWSAAVHPLAGIPLGCLACGLCIQDSSSINNRYRNVFGYALTFMSGAVIPILFYILGRKGGTQIIWQFSSLLNGNAWKDFFQHLTPWLSNRFVIWPAWSTLIAQSLPFLLFGLTIGSILLVAAPERRKIFLLLNGAICLFLAALILNITSVFSFLIEYERGNYGDRLILLGTLCLLPAALPCLNALFEKLPRRHPLLATSFVIGLASIAAAISYNALPRHDALVVGRGWSVGQADIEAVRSIDRDAAGVPYTVLANQSVSAAAISQFGFKRYAGDIFFYPIPTGGRLYETYLHMSYGEPTRETALQAAQLGQSQLVYVVLNDYWWDEEKIKTKLSLIADQSWTTGNTQRSPGSADTVFKFDFSTSTTRSVQDSGS